MKKQGIAVILMICLVISMLSGCAGKKTDSEKGSAEANASSAETAGGEKKEISITILDRGRCPAEEGTMEDNRWTRWINENSPVKVKWVPVPRTESVSKINTLFAVGEAPDLVWEYGKSFMDNLLQQGVIQPVDEYVEQYSTGYKAYLEAHPDLKPYVTGEDGKMYAFTSARTPLQVANHAMWIRQDWLDNLGIKTPATIDEFYEAAKRFTTDDPDGNGQNDTFGLGFNYNFQGIMKNMFGRPSDNGMIVGEDGKLSDWTGTQAYADCYTLLKKMYSEGIIDQEFITDSNYERQRQLLVTGKTGIYLAGWDMGSEWRELKQNVPEANWVPLEPVETAYGKYGLFQEPSPYMTICMNKEAKDPEACVEFLDWMLTEGWETLTYGFEGENYNLVDGIPQSIDPEKDQKELTYAYEYPVLLNREITDMDNFIQVTAAQDELSQEYAKIRALSLETALKNPFRRDVPYLPSTDTSSKYNSEFGPTIDALEMKMITDGGYSIEQGLKDIETEKETLGFDEVMKERQEWYDRNKDILK